MTHFNSILLTLDGSPEAAKGAHCAMWLAETLGATLHVLHATTQIIPGSEALQRLQVSNGERTGVIVHQIPGNAAAAVIDALGEYAIDLLVMSARGESASAGLVPHQSLGTVAQAVIERSPVPVLLLPLHYREVLPWTSMLAAASGEAPADLALEAAVQMAADLCLKVTVVHSEEAPLATYADMVHYEYPRRMQEMVERGLAGCCNEECRQVDQCLYRQGDPATVLLQQITRLGSSVLALGWHGALGTGRALVLKRLLEEAECALLLVRGANGSASRLMVGNEIGH